MIFSRLLVVIAAIAVGAALVYPPAVGTTISLASDRGEALEWATLAITPPLFVQQGAILRGPAVTADPADPARATYCVPGWIITTDDAGQTWQPIPTRSVAEVLADAGYAPFPQPMDGAAPTCVSALFDAAHSGSVFATFSAAHAEYGAPPLLWIALYSSDAGAHWQLVPPPSGIAPDLFGGFSSTMQGVQALFAQPQGRGYTVIESDDGGASWSPATLTCPSVGPCVRWGPAPNGTGSCAMHGYPQPIEVSLDGGQSWRRADLSSMPDACGPHALVALSATTVLAISARSEDGNNLAISTDSGATWQSVALPLLPDQPGTFFFATDLQLLPDGSLLAGSGRGWWLLRPGAQSWCAVADDVLPADTDRVWQAIGALWWFPQQASSQPAETPAAASPGTLTCRSTR
jgi:hypothetical protein